MKCSLCNWTDYDSDWGGFRWIKERSTACPECGKRFSGKVSENPISEPRLVERLNRRNDSWWVKLKRFFEL